MLWVLWQSWASTCSQCSVRKAGCAPDWSCLGAVGFTLQQGGESQPFCLTGQQEEPTTERGATSEGAGEAVGEEGRGREQCKGVSLSRLHPLAAVPFDPATVARDGAAVWAIPGSGHVGEEEPEQGEGSPGALLQGWRSVPPPGLEVGPL